MANARDLRLQSDYQHLRTLAEGSGGTLGIESAKGRPIDQYVLVYRCRGIERLEAGHPQWGAFATRRPVAARRTARVTQTHRDDGHTISVVEAFGVDTHPFAQSLAAAVVPRNAARMHPRTRRLANDQDRCRGTGLKHWARPHRQVCFACPA